ncbi:MAG: DUF4175 family protein [Polyangiaceae bacterium]|jgi:hypothetical protein
MDRVAADFIAPLVELTEARRSVTAASRRGLAAALTASVVILALLGARHGTAPWRIAAAAAIVASGVFSLLWRFVEGRWRSDPTRIVSGPISRIDRARADRVLRALSLLGPRGEARADGTSAELARVHVARALAQIPSREMMERASRSAGRVGAAAFVTGACVLAIGLARAWSVLEGGDVLVARRGVAPVNMGWLDDVQLDARPPDYLHRSEVHEPSSTPLVLPYGTATTLRGLPIHPGRSLLLTDGTSEEPFVEDGSGAVVARWLLTQSTSLRVVARFGDVVIAESRALEVQSVPDLAPTVALEGAPRQMRLIDAVEDIAVRYSVADDNGLREIHLVLRSGMREERRVLARLDGETTSFKGGSVLRLRDGFLAKSHAPVSVTVEAKDNDPLTGPKWGASDAITVIPPDIGEPEARLLDVLRRLRDSLVDTLAWRIESGDRPSRTERQELAVESQRRGVEGQQVLMHSLAETFGGVRVPAHVRAMLVAKEQLLRNAVDVEARRPSSTSHADAVKATERYLLVTDAIVRGLGMRDARSSSKELADVADDLAHGASQVQNDAADARSRGVARMDAATAVISAGGQILRRLGSLGRDLGEIVAADLARVKRARDVPDFPHAELAARDLAARLRQPDPSFDARGGRDRGGGESGGIRDTPADDGGPSDDVEQAFNAAAQDLERLAQEHAGEIDKVEQALAGAMSDEEMKQLRDSAKRHAQAVRDAARRLPAIGMGSDSWTSKGSAARDLAEQMARSLEDGRADDAVESGRSAVGSLDEAKRMLQRRGWLDDPSGERQREVEDARTKMEGEVQWAEGQRVELRRRASERARDRLEQGGEQEERFAERARELAQRGRDQASFPQQAVESIEAAERAARDAARALQKGDADKGLDLQHEAQRALDAARQQLQGDDDPGRSSGDDGDGQGPSRDVVAIPNAGEHKGPEEFRRRVMRGLGQPSTGALKDAVQRYAEGLLR